MPPIQFPMALKGCNPLRAYIRHLGTSVELEKILKFSITFFLILSLIIYIIFVIFLYFPFNQ